MKKNKFTKPPRPEVCDACFTEGNLRWNDEGHEWLCQQCYELLRVDRREFDYADGKKSSDRDMREW